MRREGADAPGAPLHELVRGGGQGAGRVDDVVDDHDVAALDLADRDDALHHVGPRAGLVADHHRAVEVLGVGVGPLRAAHVGRGDGEAFGVGLLHLLEDAQEVVARIQVVHREVEETLNLVGVEVAGHQGVGPGGFDHIGDQLRTDGHARLVLAVLAGPAEVRNHGDHLVRGGALRRVDGQEQFHQVVGGREGGLDDEAGGSAHAFRVERHEFAIAEMGDLERAEHHFRIFRPLEPVHGRDHLLGEIPGGFTGENGHPVLMDFVYHKFWSTVPI